MTVLGSGAQVIDVATLLADLLEHPSPTGWEEPVVAHLSARLAAAGFEVNVDAVGNCIATWGDGPVDVMLVGHIDTVPGEIRVRHERGRLYGRGAVDAKGPLATALCAVSRQPRSGSHRFTVVAAVGEEGDSRGARNLLTREAPDHLIVLEPSGWDAVTVGYKGIVRMDVHVRQELEHGASGSPGACDRVIGVINRLHRHAAEHNSGRRLFDQIQVRVTGLSSGNDGLVEWCRAGVAVRVPMDVRSADLTALMESWCGEHVELHVSWRCDAVRQPKHTRLGSGFVRAIRNAGGTPRFKLKTGTADMNLLVPAWGCPAVAYGPGDSHLDHTPNESIAIDELRRGVEVLTAVLAGL